MPAEPLTVLEREEIRAGIGVEMAAGFDSLGRQNRLQWKRGGTSVLDHQVSFDLAGRQTDETVNGYDAKTGAGNFTLDGAGRLTDAWTPAPYVRKE